MLVILMVTMFLFKKVVVNELNQARKGLII